MIDAVFYRPTGLLEQLETLHRSLARSFATDGRPDAIRSVAAGTFPAINVGRTEKSIEVYAFAPGLKSSDLTIEKGVLRISGERETPSANEQGGVQVYANERPMGRFTRAVSLPEDADTEVVDAKYRDGVLRVSIGLKQAAKPQRITVQ